MEVAEEAGEIYNNDNRTKTIVMNGQHNENSFEMTSIPEGADLRHTLDEGKKQNGKVDIIRTYWKDKFDLVASLFISCFFQSVGTGEFRRIILPESELNSEEEVLIAMPQTSQGVGCAGLNSSNKQTADKILALISEIGSSHIIHQGNACK